MESAKARREARKGWKVHRRSNSSGSGGILQPRSHVPHGSSNRPGPTHQALLYVGGRGAWDLTQQGCSLLGLLHHLQGQLQVLDQMEHGEGVRVGGRGAQAWLTGAITDVRACSSAWNERGKSHSRNRGCHGQGTGKEQRERGEEIG